MSTAKPKYDPERLDVLLKRATLTNKKSLRALADLTGFSPNTFYTMRHNGRFSQNAVNAICEASKGLVDPEELYACMRPREVGRTHPGDQSELHRLILCVCPYDATPRSIGRSAEILGVTNTTIYKAIKNNRVSYNLAEKILENSDGRVHRAALQPYLRDLRDTHNQCRHTNSLI